MSRPTLTIDPSAVVANWRSLAARHPGETAGVVKANAYGLGIDVIAPSLAAAGCQRFFVATMQEAITLRALLPDRWIGVLNGSPSGAEAEMIAHDLTPVLNSLDACARWRAAAQVAERPLPALLHVDTGMSRLGLDEAEFARLIADPGLIDGIGLTHIMTHLVAAEAPDDPQNARQRARFTSIAAAFPALKTSFANSAGLFLGPDFSSDLARPGYALYGGNPTPYTANPMRPAVTLSAPILQVRTIEDSETVGYNGTWTAPRRSRIATIGVGYADGLPRSLSNRMTARFNGAVIPAVGRVSMDLTTFYITDHPEISAGTTLELIGPGHDVDSLAAEAGTIGYEILTSLGPRYRRIVKSV